MAITQPTGIRKYLTNRGYKDEEINWDPERKMVTLQNKDLIGATPQADGSTYDTADNLNAALSQFKGADQQARSVDRQSQMDTLANQMLQRTQQPVTQFTKPDPFTYNAASDPQYQAALQEAAANTRTAQANTNAKLRAGGQGKSSYSESVANQIAQENLGRVSNTVLPQLMQQAYSRWQDTANMDRQNQMDNYGAVNDQDTRVAQLAQHLSGEDQRQIGNTNDQRNFGQGEADRRIALAQWLTNNYGVNAAPKADTGVAFDQVEGLQPIQGRQADLADRQLGLSFAKFDEDNKRFGEDIALRRLAQDHGISMDQAQLAVSKYNSETSRMGTNTSAANAGVNQKMDIWKATGKAPEGIPGVVAGTPYSQQQRQSKTAQDYTKDIDSSMYLSAETIPNTSILGGDPVKTGKMIVNDPAGLENYIFSLGLSDEETFQLLQRYKLVK